MLSDELIIELKNAGFPQKGAVLRICPKECEFKDGMIARMPASKNYMDEYRAHQKEHLFCRPALTEIIDCCPAVLESETIEFFLSIQKIDGKWFAGYLNHEDWHPKKSKENDIEDAVARLYIATR